MAFDQNRNVLRRDIKNVNDVDLIVVQISTETVWERAFFRTTYNLRRVMHQEDSAKTLSNGSQNAPT